jgi:hypothetical protein
MPACLPNTDNVFELPCVRGKTSQLAKLDLFLMDKLTGAIGFERGTYALFLAGYKYAADIAASSPEIILKVEGMTEWKLSRIKQFLRRHGLTFGTDIAEWREYKSRNSGEVNCFSHLRQSGFLRLVR